MPNAIEQVDALAEFRKESLEPKPSFQQRASLEIARWVLFIFAGVYVGCLLLTAGLLLKSDATFEKGSDLIKTLLQYVLPLVTLAVGYYLGEKAQPPA